MIKIFLFLLLSIPAFLVNAQVLRTIELWPGKVPGESAEKKEDAISPDHAKNVTRLSEVTNPQLVIFPAKNNNNSGAAVIVCPGGGYNILAIDLEGYEIAEWLNSIGINAFVLRYRVPKKEEGALQDAQRAIRIVRSRCKEWSINPSRIGIMGFSAGGSLSARASCRFNEKLYPRTDSSDDISCRPDFTGLIYPAYLDRGEGNSLTPELTIGKETPPVFIFATADDSHSNSALVMASSLRKAKVPVELHLMPKGGHGYGLRKWNPAGEAWPGLMASWLKDKIVN